MLERDLTRVAGEHAGDLCHALVTVDPAKARLGLAVDAGALGDEVVTLAHHGDLRQVRHDDDLVRLREVRKHGGKRTGGRTAHASINLVEDEGVDEHDGVWMPGVLSRKKQVAAPILAAAE